jgi:hypothetical protein
MQTPESVAGELIVEPLSRLGAVPVGMQVDVVGLLRTPQPLDENVIVSAASDIHADGATGGFELIEPVPGVRLGAPIALEDLGHPVTHE